MRKVILPLLIVLGLVAMAVYVVYYNRERLYPEVNFTLLNEAETAWYNAGIMDYRTVVDVEFATEHRRHAITVQNGQITEATLSYLRNGKWTAPEPLSLTTAADYTIPGLFTFLRLELNQALRETIRTDMHADPTYPRYIYFGTVWIDNAPMEGSEARFTVVEFEQLPPP